MVVFAFFFAMVCYYYLLKYLAGHKPMILPYSFHKFRNSLKKSVNDYGQTVILLDNPDAMETSFAIGVGAGYFQE
jgi:hypothetical protein